MKSMLNFYSQVFIFSLLIITGIRVTAQTPVNLTDTTVTVVSPGGVAAKIPKASGTKAGVMSAFDKTKLDKIEPVNSYIELRTVPNINIKIAYQLQYNKTIGNFYYDPADVSSVDDSAMVIVTAGGARLKRYVEDKVNVRWFGAVGDGSTDDYYNVQRALNYIATHKTNWLYFPFGTYKNASAKSWLVWLDNNKDGNPDFVNVKITGQSTGYGAQSGNEVTLWETNGDGFALGIQRGKGCIIENINFLGPNQLNYASMSVKFNPATTYALANIRTNRFSPHAGLVLDPFGNGTSGINCYPNMANYYTGTLGGGGSTDCHFTNLSFNGFYVSIMLTPNSSTQNNEQHSFNHMWFTNTFAAYAIGQNQSRNIYIEDVKAWESVHTVFESSRFGPGNGDCPIINNVNIAGGVYELLNMAGYAIKISNVYAESLYSLGYFGAEINELNHSTIDFADGGNAFPYPNYIFATNGNIQFNNCRLMYYTGLNSKTPMNIYNVTHRQVKFTNCYLTNEVSDIHSNGLLPLNIEYDKTIFYQFPGTILSEPFVIQDQEYRTYAQSNNNETKFVNYGKEWTTYNPQYKHNITQTRRSTVPFVRYINPGVLKFTLIGGNRATATSGFTNPAAGAYIIGQVIRAQLAADPLITPQVARIDSIASNGSGTVYFSRCISSLTAGSHQIYVPFYSQVEPIVIGAITQSGNTVSNVISEVSGSAVTIPVNSWIWIDGYNYTVASSSPGSFTVYGSIASQSNDRAIITTGLEFNEYGQSSGRPDLVAAIGGDHIGFTKGAYYKNTSGTDTAGWYCVKTGVTNSPYPPVFTPVGLLPLTSASPLVYSAVADKTLSNTTTASSLIPVAGRGSLFIPANTLVAGSVIEIDGEGIFSGNSGVAFTITFGNGASLITTRGITGTTSVNLPFKFHFTATVRTAGSSGTMAMAGFYSINNNSQNLLMPSANAPINTSATQKFDVTGAFASASIANAVTIQQATIKVY